MTTTSKTVSVLLPDQIPDYVQEYYPLFVIFVTKYYEWLEQQGNAQQVIQNIRLNGDIDTTASSLVTRFMQQFVPDQPLDPAADRSIIVKYFRDFYQKKGSEDSFKFFFRAFFADEIQTFYPSSVLFKTSDNTWYVERRLRVTAVTGNPGSSISTTIAGLTSGARAVVNTATEVTDGGNYWDLILQPNTTVGVFTQSETLRATYWNWNTRTSSQVTMTLAEPVITSQGRFLNTQSMLSADQVLQDSYYYQQFSYVLRTRIGRDQWASAIMKQLHPAGMIMFNDLLLDSVDVSADTTSFARTVNIETTVRVPTAQEFYVPAGYTFDRLADFRTGTSTTTAAGAIVYDADYLYPGEKVTWALQKVGDFAIYGEQRQETIPEGPSFDKINPNVALKQQIITAGNGIDFNVVNERYRNTSSMSLSAGTVLATFTTSISALTSLLLLATWVKDATGNATNELANNLYIEITAETPDTVTVLDQRPINISDETQRNYQHVALGSSQLYKDLIYYVSSNTLTTAVSSTTVGATSVTTVRNVVFRPFNAERAQSYSRFSGLLQGNSELTAETITVSISVSSDSIFAATDTDFLTIHTIGL
jgi:hypothetical protein